MKDNLKGEKENRIALLSRAGTINSYLLKVDNDVYEWHTIEDDMRYRISYSKEDNDEIFMLDPEDGPAVGIGYDLENKKVYRIRRVKEDNGYSKYLVYFK